MFSSSHDSYHFVAISHLFSLRGHPLSARREGRSGPDPFTFNSTTIFHTQVLFLILRVELDAFLAYLKLQGHSSSNFGPLGSVFQVISEHESFARWTLEEKILTILRIDFDISCVLSFSLYLAIYLSL